MNRLVVWGGLEDKSSHRFIHGAFFDNARKLDIDSSIWLANRPDNAWLIQSGDTVLSADLYLEYLPYVEGVDYILHNADGGHPLCQALERTPERLLRLQVWTDDAAGERWGPCRSFDHAARTLFQPWGSDLLAEEFLEPVVNPDSRDVVFVGAVWSDTYQGVELGNERVIDELKEACAQHRLNFVHATQVSDEKHRALLRGARLTPALAGEWQVEHGYIPCRAFKLPAYGCAMFTNVPAVDQLFYPEYEEAWEPPSPVGEMVERMLSLSQTEYVETVREQQQVAARFTYREALAAIGRAFAEMRA